MSVPSPNWEYLIEHPDLLEQFKTLAHTLVDQNILAQAQAEVQHTSPESVLDMRPALAILEQHPGLKTYLMDAVTLSQARAFAFSSTDATKGVGGALLDTGTTVAWGATPSNAPQGVKNTKLLRDYADNDEWVRAAINIRKTQVTRADVAIRPKDPRKPWNKTILKSLDLLFDQPNEYRDTYTSLLSAFLEDYFVLGRGIWTKGMTVSRKPTTLYYEDAAAIKIYPGWSGDPDEPRYLYDNGQAKTLLRNDEVMILFAMSASHRFGMSYVQALVESIEADIRAGDTAARVLDQKPMSVLIQLLGASSNQVQLVRNTYNNEYAGRKEVLFMGGQQPVGVHPLTFSPKDSQFMEYQDYLMRKICAVFQISPQQLGMTMDINLANGQVQRDIFEEDVGLLPLLLDLEETLNRQILADFAPSLPLQRTNLDALNIRLLFPQITEAQRRLHYERTINMSVQALAGLPAATLNQVLEMRGEEPVPGGNTFYIKTMQGAVPFLSYDNVVSAFLQQSPDSSEGAQDAAGGIDAEDYDDDIPDSSASGSGDAANGSAGEPTASASDSGSTGNTPDAHPESPETPDLQQAFRPTKKNTHDPRPFGKTWYPGLQRQHRYALGGEPPSSPPHATPVVVDPRTKPAYTKIEQTLTDHLTQLFAELDEQGKKALAL